MNVIERGEWEIYQASDQQLAERKLTRQHGVVFCRSKSTGQDWYDFRDAFAGTTVLATLTQQHDGLVVGAANTNANFIFPSNGGLLEIEGYAGNNPQADFGNKIYDPEDQTFTDRVPPEPLSVRLTAIREEISRLQKQVAELLGK